MDDNTDVPLAFKRNALTGFPEALETLAKRVDKSRAESLRKCAGIFRGWLSGNAQTIYGTRSEKSWRWLIVAANEAGCMTLAKVIETKLYQFHASRDFQAERENFNRRVADAMAEYRAGGGAD